MITICASEILIEENYRDNSIEGKVDYFTDLTIDDLLENHDGSTMFVASAGYFRTMEVLMPISSDKPLTVRWAISLCAITIATVLGVAGGTYALIHSDVNDVRSEVNSARDKNGSDSDSLRSDMNRGFERVSDKLDAVNRTLNTIQVDQALQKRQSSTQQ
ncbi:hypothetical protein ACNSPD_16875 [Yersinia enterocolitica]|uniref:hypothetical protein n=1 Tax=Yersinia TaxID=629 RepID=UPI003AB45BF3